VLSAGAHFSLLDRGPQWCKHAFDILATLMMGLWAVPLGLLIALAIVLDSRGPVFFTHMRVGKGGRLFPLRKFRSMVKNADQCLEQHLRDDPELAREWSLSHKLRRDPRVTRVGRWLRKTSMDELPQLWNVLRGEMSLVGPRPIVSAEAAKYGSAFDLYKQVSPGLTGLWQVSGRTHARYRRRVALDCHYIRNWTLFLDLKILLKTVAVVVRGHGAY
jgi:Undecaprenyl-phosphate galactose phosphotransferase WbaP